MAITSGEVATDGLGALPETAELVFGGNASRLLGRS